MTREFHQKLAEKILEGFKDPVKLRRALIVREEFSKKPLKGNLMAQATLPSDVSEKKKDPTAEEHIRKWLSNLINLKGVPFQYLVPDEKLLPIESIRFFYLDRNWIRSLVDGALSLGRAIEGDMALAEAIEKPQEGFATKEAHQERSSKLGKTLMTSGTVTGFLLRSSLLKDYPGVEFHAFSEEINVSGDMVKKEDKELGAILLKPITPNLLLGLYSGEIKSLVIQKPTEALHFGIGVDGKKKLRNPETGAEVEAQKVSVGVRTEKNVLKVRTLAKEMEKTNSKLKPISSADFALQMVQGVDAALLTLTTKENDDD